MTLPEALAELHHARLVAAELRAEIEAELSDVLSTEDDLRAILSRVADRLGDLADAA